MLAKVLHALVARPAVYEAVQRFAGFETMRREIEPFLQETSGSSVLDIGAGTGSLRDLLPSDVRYLWLDVDSQKLEGYRARYPSAPAVLASGSQICLGDKSVDYALCVAIAHHLTDEQFPAVLGEAARVVRRGLIFLDGVRSEDRFISNMMWRYDRGSHPRFEEQLRANVERFFVLKKVANYSIYHRYFVCLAEPRKDR